MGMFCKFGSCELSRPVEVAAWLPSYERGRFQMAVGKVSHRSISACSSRVLETLDDFMVGRQEQQRLLVGCVRPVLVTSGCR